MKKRILLTILISVASVLFLSPQVFAVVGGGATAGTYWSGGGSGTGCKDYWDTCYGYSWQAYDVVEDFPNNTVTFHYTENTNAGNRPVYINYCSRGQTLYNLGFATYGSAGYGYQVSTQRNKNINQNHAGSSVGLGAYTRSSSNKATVQKYTTARGYVNQDVVQDEYSKAQIFLKQHPEWQASFYGFDMRWEDVGAFCWSADLPSFYSVSNASAKVKGTNNNSYITTGIVNENKTVTAGTLNVKAGTQVEIVFSHNVYTNNKYTGKKGWTVGRDFQTKLNGTNGPSSGESTFTDNWTNKYYTANSQPYTDGTYKYVVRDVYTFNTSAKMRGSYKFCESITIDGHTTKACAIVNVGNSGGGGTGQQVSCGESVIPVPSSYKTSSSSSGTTSVASKVRNASLGNSYSNFQNTVYAKPGDDINWCNAYFPGVQFAAFSTVSVDNIHRAHNNYHSNFVDNSITNKRFADYSDWTNKYTITSSNIRPNGYSVPFQNLGKGNTAYKYISNSSVVQLGQAGKIISETITSGGPTSASVTNEGIHRWSCDCYTSNCGKCGQCSYSCNCHTTCSTSDGKTTCTRSCKTCYRCCSCCKATCSHSSNFYKNSRSGSGDSATSYVYVPYNFINTASVSLSSSMVYSGESIRIRSAEINVNQKYNGTTEGTYATQVEDAKIRLVGYVSSSSSGSEKITSRGICSALPYKNGYCDEALESYSRQTLNRNGSMSGSTDSVSFADSYNIFDANAGDYYCVVLAVYPATSGSDTNMSAAGSKSWYISKPSCSIIAKRPSFQVWGGSVYSEGAVDTLTSVAAKKNLQGESYSNKGNGVKRIFSSWVEQAVISNGFVSGLASGAAGVDYADAYGGSKQTDFCNRVPLSIANYGTLLCKTYQQTGNAGLPVLTGVQDNLMNYWGVNEGTATIRREGTYNLGSSAYYTNTTNTQGINIRYTEKDPSMSQDLTISGVTIPKGVTHVVKAKGNITIGGDISYQGGTYTSQKDIPKMIIYSDKNINISCNVNRVDAIIIAKGWVYTCESSRQLKINGMVIAEGITFERTYGAGVGTNSGVPAEIVNYDSSAIVWGKGMSVANDFKSLKTVYQHEVAPRY